MKNKISIACIIATHDRIKLLIETINSVLQQTELPDEIIISDNNPSIKKKKNY